MLTQTDVITHVSGIETVPQMPTQPRFLRYMVEQLQGDWMCAYQQTPSRELMGALGTHLLAHYSP